MTEDKKTLDKYIQRIRTLKPLLPEEWEELRKLAENELSIKKPFRPGFENLMYKDKDVATGATMRPEVSEDSIFSKKP